MTKLWEDVNSVERDEISNMADTVSALYMHKTKLSKVISYKYAIYLLLLHTSILFQVTDFFLKHNTVRDRCNMIS